MSKIQCVFDEKDGEKGCVNGESYYLNPNDSCVCWIVIIQIIRLLSFQAQSTIATIVNKIVPDCEFLAPNAPILLLVFKYVIDQVAVPLVCYVEVTVLYSVLFSDRYDVWNTLSPKFLMGCVIVFIIAVDAFGNITVSIFVFSFFKFICASPFAAFWLTLIFIL